MPGAMCEGDSLGPVRDGEGVWEGGEAEARGEEGVVLCDGGRGEGEVRVEREGELVRVIRNAKAPSTICIYAS